MNAPNFRVRSPRSLSGLLFAAAAALVFATAAVLLAGVVAPRANAQETELPSVSADSVGDDFLTPPRPPAAPGAPPAPGAPGAPVGPDGMTIRGGTGERTIEGPGGHYKVHVGKNDVVQMGEDIVIERGEHVLGHVLAMGGSVTVRGVVDDDVVAMGGDVILEDGAQVRGDAVAIGGNVEKAPGASIVGSAVSLGNIPAGVVGLSGLNFLSHGFDAIGKVFKILFWLFIAWLVVTLTRDRARRIIARIESDTLASIGYGALGLCGIVPATIVVALAAVLLVVTIIGIPVAVLLLLGYALALVVLVCWGVVLGAAALGGWLVRRLAPRLGQPELVRNTLVGVVAVMGLGLVASLFQGLGMFVPPAGILGGLLDVVGLLVGFGAMCAGIGGILRTRAGQPAPIPVDWSVPPVAPPAAPDPPPATT